MLRLAVAALLFVNLVFFAWTQGWLDDITGVRATGDHEPERITKQVRPEQIRVLPPQAPGSAASDTGSGAGLGSGSSSNSSAATPAGATSSLAAAARTFTQAVCLEAGPFAADDIGGANTALQAAMPADARSGWATVKIDRPGSWVVFMGKYSTRDALLKKVEELKRRNVRYEELRTPPVLDGGLTLGRYDDRAGAERALAQLNQQGIHTARVVDASSGPASYMLRAASAEPTLASRLAALKLEALGKGFAECAKSPTTQASAN